MKHIKITTLFITILFVFQTTIIQAQEEKDPTQITPCEKWTEDATKDSKNEKYKGKLCTDLLEGLPCAALAEGKCTADNCALGAHKKDLCYAIITGSGLKGIEIYVAIMYRYASWIIGIAGVLMIIIAGIQIALGGASQEAYTQGKKRIMQVIAGLVLFFLIGVILRTINPHFFT